MSRQKGSYFRATLRARNLRRNVDKCHVIHSGEVESKGCREDCRRKIEVSFDLQAKDNAIQPLTSSKSDAQMISTIVIGICIGLSHGFRGPHHPRSAISHHHYSPQKNVKITQDADLLHDATHLKEDMGSLAEELDFSNMTDQEIEFHYFKVHDVDNNAKLDGLEILHAIQHTFHEHRLSDVEHGNLSKETSQVEYQDDFPWIVELIDRVLDEDDLDNDGYLGYIEYVLGRQRDHIAQANRNTKLRIGK